MINKIDFGSIEKSLNIIIPKSVIQFIEAQIEYTIQCGNLSWDIWNDTKSIIDYSESLSADLKLKMLIIADNGIGDYLLLLPDNENISPQLMKKNIYVLEHESGTIKYYSSSLEEALIFTDEDDFFFKKTFAYKLENNELIKGTDE
jgi:uncharacterized phage-like protein YoqJ